MTGRQTSRGGRRMIERSSELPGRLLPDAAILPPTGGLMFGDDHQSVFDLPARGKPRRGRVGAFERIEDQDLSANSGRGEMPGFTRLVHVQEKAYPSGLY